MVKQTVPIPDTEKITGTMRIGSAEFYFTAKRKVTKNRFLSVANAAEYIGINKATIYYMIKHKLVPESAIYKTKGLRTQVDVLRVKKAYEEMKKNDREL